MSCKGVCDRLRALKPSGKGRYQSGQKRCQSCSIFITTIALRCPCCNERLRGKPRNLKYKEKLRASNAS